MLKVVLQREVKKYRFRKPDQHKEHKHTGEKN